MILQRHNETLNLYRLFVDMTLIVMAWALSFFIRFDLGIIDLPKGTDSFLNYCKLVPVILFVYLFIFITLDIYKSSFVSRKIWDENFLILKAHTLSFFAFITVCFFIFEHRYSRITLIVFFWTAPIFLFFGRSFIRKLNRAYLKNSEKKECIIIGNPVLSEKLKQIIQSKGDWKIKVSHIFQIEEKEKYVTAAMSNHTKAIFIIADDKNHAQIKEIYSILGNTLAEVFLIPDFNNELFLSPSLICMDNLTAISLNSFNLQGNALIIKRLFDIIFSLTIISVFSPLFLLCAILVKISSKGPILYKQERMGLDGRKFMCFKFRGMYESAEKTSGPVWATQNDDRTTPIGKLLRKTSMDELPQFFNVLKGEMSIVGPRPERPVFVEDFRHKIPGYMLRHKAKAGITGWAQISGWRGNTSLERRIECDLWYIKNWSFWLDLKIILLTPFKGLLHPNAY